MMRRLLLSVGSCGCGRWLLVGVAPSLASSDPPLLPLKRSWALSPLHPTLRSSPRSHSSPPPLPSRAPLCSRSRRRPSPCSRHRFLALAHHARYSPWYQIVRQAPGLAPEVSEYLQALSPVYSDDAACEMACLICSSSFSLMCTTSSDIRQNLRPKFLGT